MLETDTYLASWIGSAAAYRVEVNIGSGYTVLNDPYAFYSRQFTTSSSTITVRITPYANNDLLLTEALTATLTIAAAPAGLSVTAGVDSIDASWSAVTGATGYQVSLYVDADVQSGVFVESTSVSVQTDSLVPIGGPWPDFEVRVAAMVNGQLGRVASYSISVPPLPAPTGLVLQSVLDHGVTLFWSAVSGATGYQVFVGDDDEFDPATEGTQVYVGATPSCVAAVDVDPPYAHYFRVAATSVYYRDAEDLSFGDALEVAS
jgi:hypothetical protein